MGYAAGFITPGNQPEIETETEREKEERKKDTGTKALMEQRCFNQHGLGNIVVILSKDKD